MADVTPSSTPPVALLVDAEEWRARSLESVFRLGGYAVVKSDTGTQVIDLVERIAPDVVLVDRRLSDVPALELLGLMQRSSRIRLSTPRFILTSSELGRQETIDLLRAGAWSILRPPFDAEQILLQVGTLVAAKRESDAALAEGLRDPDVGCYNLQGVLKRALELTADAVRHARPLACVVVASGRASLDAGSGDARDTALRSVADALAATLRTSDSLGCLDDGRLVVLAPGTDSTGAGRLAERILAVADELHRRLQPANRGGAPLMAGIYGGGTSYEQEIGPVDLLSRATLALRMAREGSPGESRIRWYES